MLLFSVILVSLQNPFTSAQLAYFDVAQKYPWFISALHPSLCLVSLNRDGVDRNDQLKASKQESINQWMMLHYLCPSFIYSPD